VCNDESRFRARERQQFRAGIHVMTVLSAAVCGAMPSVERCIESVLIGRHTGESVDVRSEL
jgi:hypothetical protein